MKELFGLDRTLRCENRKRVVTTKEGHKEGISFFRHDQRRRHRIPTSRGARRRVVRGAELAPVQQLVAQISGILAGVAGLSHFILCESKRVERARLARDPGEQLAGQDT
jgi:hypothetical protein